MLLRGRLLRCAAGARILWQTYRLSVGRLAPTHGNQHGVHARWLGQAREPVRGSRGEQHADQNPNQTGTVEIVGMVHMRLRRKL